MIIQLTTEYGEPVYINTAHIIAAFRKWERTGETDTDGQEVLLPRLVLHLTQPQPLLVVKNTNNDAVDRIIRAEQREEIPG